MPPRGYEPPRPMREEEPTDPYPPGEAPDEQGSGIVRPVDPFAVSRRRHEAFDPTNPDHVRVHGVPGIENNVPIPRSERRQREAVEPHFTRRAVAGILAGLVAAGLVLAARAGMFQDRSDKLDLLDQDERASQPAHQLEIEGLEHGTEIKVFTRPLVVEVGSINIRTSPEVTHDETSERSNLADFRALVGEKVLILGGAIVDSRDNNEQWVMFTDQDGQKFYINLTALQEQGVDTTRNPDTVQTVRVTATTNAGNEAQTETGRIVPIATGVVID